MRRWLLGPTAAHRHTALKMQTASQDMRGRFAFRRLPSVHCEARRALSANYRAHFQDSRISVRQA